MSVYEIPIPQPPGPCAFSITFPNGVGYQMRLLYQFNDDACWILDIGDAQGNPIVCGIPLVTGADLLAQFSYLGFAASLYVTTDGDLAEPPHYWNLGTTAHLWLEG